MGVEGRHFTTAAGVKSRWVIGTAEVDLLCECGKWSTFRWVEHPAR